MTLLLAPDGKATPEGIALIDQQIAAWRLWAKTPSLAKASKALAASQVAALTKYRASL